MKYNIQNFKAKKFVICFDSKKGCLETLSTFLHKAFPDFDCKVSGVHKYYYADPEDDSRWDCNNYTTKFTKAINLTISENQLCQT